MSNDINKLLNDFVKIDWSAELEKQAKVLNTPVVKPYNLDIDPDELPVNRTANGVEQMVEILTVMNSKIDDVEKSQADIKEQISTIQDESRSTESHNLKLTHILIGIGVLTLLATIVGLYV